MIATERLSLREWRDEDVPALWGICREPEVMRFIGPLQDEAEIQAAVARQQASQVRDGYCYWALERSVDGALIGFCGLMKQAASMPIAGVTDIGWRLTRSCWGHGYAEEAARASLGFGWRTGLDQIVAITVPANRRSWRLMERLGMTRRLDEDFDHPNLAPDDPLRHHILYRIARPI